MCHCDFQECFISQAVLLCDKEEPTQVVYRASIFRYGSYPANQLVGYIEEWVKQGASVTIAGLVQVTFDSDCPVRIFDMDEPICVQQLTVAVIQTLMSTPVPNLTSTAAAQSLDMSTLATTVAIASLALFVTVLIIVVIILLVYFHRKKGKL